MVVELLVIAQCAVVNTDALYLDIGLGAVDGYALRCVLLETETAVVDVGPGAVAVYEQFHQAVIG